VREDQVVAGKVRKYYRATPLGEQALDEARDKIWELVSEVVQGEGSLSPAQDRQCGNP